MSTLVRPKTPQSVGVAVKLAVKLHRVRLAIETAVDAPGGRTYNRRMRTRGLFALASLLSTASIIASGHPRRIGAHLVRRQLDLPPKTSPPFMLLVQVASGVTEPCMHYARISRGVLERACTAAGDMA